MSQESASEPFRYTAFVSYAHADRSVAERFHKALEDYRVPKSLVGSDYGSEPVPRSIGPLFFDRSDANVGADLDEAIKGALDRSDALLVLCSPAAARSIWVAKEIRYFRSIGRANRIFAVLLDGAPHKLDPDTHPDGAFPGALLERIDVDGKVASEGVSNPLACDLRASGDGFDNARLKVVSALTGVPQALLSERQKIVERRERRNLYASLVVLIVLLAVSLFAGLQAWRSRLLAEQRLQDAIEVAARRVDDGGNMMTMYGVPDGAIQRLLEAADADFIDLVKRVPDTAALRLERARLSSVMAKVYGQIGKRANALATAKGAHTFLENIPEGSRILVDLALSLPGPSQRDILLERIGVEQALANAEWDSQNDDQARSAQQRAIDHAAELVSMDASDIVGARALATQHAGLGKMDYEVSNLEDAIKSYDKALAAIAAVPAASSELKFEEADALSEKGQALFELSSHKEALAAESRAVEILESLIKTEPTKTDAKHLLAAALARRADAVFAVTRDAGAARADRLRAAQILQDLTTIDPARVDWSRDAGIAFQRVAIGDMTTGRFADAQRAYKRAQEKFDALLIRTPGPKVQRDLSVLLENIGDLAALQGRWRPAHTSYQESKVLRHALLAEIGDDDRDVAEHDLAVILSKVGKAEARRGGSARSALVEYDNAIRWIRGLVRRRPEVIDWRRELAVFLFESYPIARRVVGRKAASIRLTEAIGVMKQLTVDKPDNAQYRADLRAMLQKS